MKNLSLVLIILVLFLMSNLSCIRKAPPGIETSSGQLMPERVIEKFVRLSASAEKVEDKTSLKEMCSGPMKFAFEKLSDDDFRLTYLGDKLDVREVKVLEAKVESEKAKIKYRLELTNKRGSQVTQESSDREAELRLVDGKWAIEFIKPVGVDKLAFTDGMMF